MKRILNSILVVLATSSACMAGSSITVELSVAGASACTFGASSIDDSFGTGSGGGAGKVKIGDVKIKKSIDQCSVPLFSSLSNSIPFSKVKITIEVQKVGAGPMAVLLFTLTNAAVTSVTHSDVISEDGPTETIGIHFEAVDITYKAQDPSSQDTTVTCSTKTESCSFVH
jgi:type VI protein secretion system component Hcp